MEFNEKLQELRKRKGLTQEELAGALYVSRTAVSKWESGRGYPNIDSLKSIAKFFSVTIDELLSSEEVLFIAEEDNKQKEQHFCSMATGLLDLSTGMLLFLPFFGERASGSVHAVPLPALNAVAAYLIAAYWIVIIGMIASGVMTLALQNSHSSFLLQNKNKVSLALNFIGTLLFIISSQPYAAALLFVFLIIKLLLPGKKQ